jgi:hypothetical protein
MKRFGQLLLVSGLVLGVTTGAALLFPWQLTGFAWLLGVGAVKLAFGGALGLMAGGAVCQRLAARADALLPRGTTPVP